MLRVMVVGLGPIGVAAAKAVVAYGFPAISGGSANALATLIIIVACLCNAAHISVGAIAQNAIVLAKPAGAKGVYIRGASLATTMGPGIRLDLSSTLAMSGSAV